MWRWKASPANSEALMALPFDDSMTVAEKLTEQTGVIGEKLEDRELRAFER